MDMYTVHCTLYTHVMCNDCFTSVIAHYTIAHYMRVQCTCPCYEHLTMNIIIINDYKLYYILIVAVESDTRKYHEFIATYCYECAARVTMLEAMNE